MATVPAPTDQSLRARFIALTRRHPDQVAIVVMAVLGIAVSIYLTAEHYAKVPLLCSTNGLVDCASVLTSSYAVVPGTTLPITFPGLLWFVASGGLALWGLRELWRGQPEPTWLRPTQQGWGALGLFTVLYLVSAEIDNLHRLCAWCTVVHLLVLATFLVSLYFRTIPKYDQGRTGAVKAVTPPRAKPQLIANTTATPSARPAGKNVPQRGKH